MSDAKKHLSLAARLAALAAGDVEPNPMVGAVLVRDGQVIGLGHHRRYGGLHAEREALADCRGRGNDPRGCTAYVTLEPCRHHGKQPPCTDALIEAGVARVVYARPDPNDVSRGGETVLREAGIDCVLCDESTVATRISDPFVKRVTTGLPWVVAKWAQTADGRMTTPPGDSPWISTALSLRRVHRLRARVDAVVTGAGTLLADDPLLTARGVPRVRRVARRVVVAGRREFPPGLRLTADAGPPVSVVRAPSGMVDLRALLLDLAHGGVSTVMLECGPTLLAGFFGAGLVDEAFVYVAPASRSAGWPAGPADAPGAAALAPFELVREKPLGGDTERWYRRPLGRPLPG